MDCQMMQLDLVLSFTCGELDFVKSWQELMCDLTSSLKSGDP